MSAMELRLLFARVYEGRNKATAIRNHQLQRGSGGAFVVAGGVVGVPHQDRGHGGIQAGGHQEGHAVLDLWVVDGDVGNDGVADDGGDQREEHDDAAQLEPVREDGDRYRHHGCDRVWNHRPQLCFVGGVA